MEHSRIAVDHRLGRHLAHLGLATLRLTCYLTLYLTIMMLTLLLKALTAGRSWCFDGHRRPIMATWHSALSTGVSRRWNDEGAGMAASSDRGERQARTREEDVRKFYTHLGVYLVVIGFLFILNLLTSADSLWFFWPALGWGISLGIHAWNTLAVDRLMDRQRHGRRPSSTTARKRTMAAPVAPSADPAEVERLFEQGAAKVDAMRFQARRISKVDIRDQALGICAQADRILGVIGDNPDESALARDFINRYLDPAEAILTQYARLSSRNVPSAQATLAQVETHDLPLLEAKLDELYDRLHRGQLIDLEVAREMLAFDFANATVKKDD